MAVILETSLGDMTIDLYTEERPRCCMNFLKLCKIKYYNLCLIHSVQRNLVAQTGDPTGTGKGGQSIYGKLYGEQAAFFEPEYKPRIKHKKIGTVSMVNNGENLHGSQFFITTGSDVDYLDNVHTVFGEVSEGHDILQKINETIVDGEHRPFKDIRIFHTVVLDDPYDDQAELSAYIPDRSPEPTKEQLASNRIGVDEDLDDMEGKTEAELTKILSDREAKANAQILEMVGDLPDAEVAPEDNVLFVCKLNPVTTEDDLEIIFSRFGEIKGCEVIKDKKTEESLQYAFIEFEKVADCESAYFKMDNVIIDDRRIHVDFSQSVAKIKWDRKGKGGKDQEEGRPSFIIKDKSRRDDRYDFVFSDNEDGGASSSKKKHKKKKKKHKKHKKSDSDSSEDDASPPQKKKEREASRSRSPPPKKQYADKQRQRRYSPERNAGTDRHMDRDRDRSRERDRTREQGGDRGRDKNRGRDREGDRHIEGRDRRDDRQQDRRKDRQRDRSRDRDSDRRRDR